ncbi:putative quinol monooxygenase [Maridesulfovibrio sp.]|uniref:putative quinol monooxygenase n=1 Tax=Maridesulfovibrio sp. TaxID=2795000 RepID=UPI003BACBABD
MSTITVTGAIQAKKEHADAFRSAFIKYTKQCANEPGVITFNLHEANDAPGHFIVYERWASVEMFEKHMQGKLLADFIAANDDFIEHSEDPRFLTPLAEAME